MKHKISEYISFRDVPLALVCSTIWFVVLWAANYPEDERVGVAIVGYVALWASRWAVNALALFTLRRLNRLALRKADEFGVEIPQEPSPAVATFARAAAGAFLFAMILAIVGMSAAATVPIAAAVGLPPLAAGFGVFGWTAFGVGASVLLAIVGVPFILFKWTEKVAVNMRRLSAGISALSDILRAPLPKPLALVVGARVG